MVSIWQWDIISNMFRHSRAFFAILFSLCSSISAAQTESTKQFLSDTFGDTTPAVSTFWLQPHHKESLKAILGHDTRKLRIKYWHNDNSTAWVMDEIGKEKPITIGVVIRQQKIDDIAILVYREPRGYEVQRQTFLDQFKLGKIDKKLKLDRTIDGITGATLSVAAVTNVARAALYLDSLVKNNE